MKNNRILTKINILILFVLMLSIGVTQAAQQALTIANSGLPGALSNTPPMLIPPAPKMNAKGYVLMDADSGRVLVDKNMDARMPPASLTKLMTLYIAFSALQSGQIHLDDNVRISKTAWKTGGSRMFLKQGALVSVEDLIQGIIVDSGNDATVALAEYIAGSQSSFVPMMNQQAQILGMKNTHYEDVNGLPHPNHYSSPHDMVILAHAIIKHFPQYYHWFKQKYFTFDKIKQTNRNRLLWRDPSVDGLKTGHTESAGYCLVASAKQDNMRLISVVMGTPTDAARADDSLRLLNYGFRFYKTYQLFQANQPVKEVRVWQGKNPKTVLGLAQDLNVTIPNGRYKKLQTNIQLNGNVIAPVVRGVAYGTLTVSLNDKPIARAPLYALKDDPKGGLWTRLSDKAKLAVFNLFTGDKASS